jgi:hypothetical protein
MKRSRLEAIHLPDRRATHGSPVHLIDVENGMEVPISGADRILLHIRNDGPSVATVTIHGGDRLVRLHGNGEAEQIAIAPLETRFVGPIDAAAFTQPGGVIWLDFPPECVGRITAYRVD